MSIAAVAMIAIGGAARAVAGEAVPEPELVALPDMALPIIDHGQVEGMLRIKAMLNAADGHAGETEAALPVVRAALLTAAADQARLYASPNKAVDQQRLVEALGAAVKQAGLKADVLILEAVARPAD